MIARIAESYLTPKTKAAVAELLGKQTPCDVATWADYIRTQPGYEWSKVLHGASVPKDNSKFDMDRDCKKGCAVSAILRFTDTLKDPKAERKDRVEALKFIIHFVGDLHQPIHVISRDEDRCTRSDLTFFSEPARLHKVWDALILLRAGKQWEPYAEELRKKITPELFAKWASSTDPVDWANESHEITVRYAYDLPKDGKLGQEYCDRCLPPLEIRIQQGGVRLAARLNAIFDPGTTTRPGAAKSTSAKSQ